MCVLYLAVKDLFVLILWLNMLIEFLFNMRTEPFTADACNRDGFISITISQVDLFTNIFFTIVMLKVKTSHERIHRKILKNLLMNWMTYSVSLAHIKWKVWPWHPSLISIFESVSEVFEVCEITNCQCSHSAVAILFQWLSVTHHNVHIALYVNLPSTSQMSILTVNHKLQIDIRKISPPTCGRFTQ